jgi:hypothetical protein
MQRRDVSKKQLAALLMATPSLRAKLFANPGRRRPGHQRCVATKSFRGPVLEPYLSGVLPSANRYRGLTDRRYRTSVQVGLCSVWRRRYCARRLDSVCSPIVEGSSLSGGSFNASLGDEEESGLRCGARLVGCTYVWSALVARVSAAGGGLLWGLWLCRSRLCCWLSRVRWPRRRTRVRRRYPEACRMDSR